MCFNREVTSGEGLGDFYFLQRIWVILSSEQNITKQDHTTPTSESVPGDGEQHPSHWDPRRLTSPCHRASQLCCPYLSCTRSSVGIDFSILQRSA